MTRLSTNVGKRKSSPRYFELELPLRFICTAKHSAGVVGSVGSGRSLRISRDSIEFELDCKVMYAWPGSQIDVYLEWPAALPDGTPLSLFLQGYVNGLKRDQSPITAEVEFSFYEFKTRMRELRGGAADGRQVSRPVLDLLSAEEVGGERG